MARHKTVRPGRAADIPMMRGTWQPTVNGCFVLFGLPGDERKPRHKRGVLVVPLNRAPFYEAHEAGAERIATMVTKTDPDTGRVTEEKQDLLPRQKPSMDEPGWAVRRYDEAKRGEWHQEALANAETGEVRICLMLNGKVYYQPTIIGGQEVPTGRMLVQGFAVAPDEEDAEVPEQPEVAQQPEVATATN